jgi:hypothetical protein
MSRSRCYHQPRRETSEPPRACPRPLHVARSGHGQERHVQSSGPRADGSGLPGVASTTSIHERSVVVDCIEAWLPPRDAAAVGSRRLDGRRSSAHSGDRRAGPHQGPGARESRAQEGERDSSEGICAFRPGGARSPTELKVAFIDEHRATYGVEPICAELRIAPSTYDEAARQRR